MPEIHMLKIEKITPNSILLTNGNFMIKVFGESFVQGYGSPDFIVDESSIKSWIGPNGEQHLSEQEKREICDFLLNELRHKGWLIEIE